MSGLVHRLSGLVVAAIVVLALGVGGFLAVGALSSTGKTVTAYFPRTIGLYAGSSVRVLGVPIGKITSITPEGTQVRVVMTYRDSVKVPADAGAAIVPPSIVSDRYVQLIPAYTGGPVMGSGAVIPESRTEVPLELDQIFANLNQLNIALGPNGANKHGALSQLISVSARNLKGNGARLHDTLNAVGQALGTLAGSKDQLFGTLANLQQFTTTLAQDNSGVLAVNNDLAQVSVQLNGERSDLGAALHDLAVALGQVTTFVADNKAELTSDVSGLANITGTLVKEQTSLTEFLDDAPAGLQNLGLAYDSKYTTLDTRNNSQNTPNLLACQVFYALGQKTCPVAGPAPSLPGGSLPAALGGALIAPRGGVTGPAAATAPAAFAAASAVTPASGAAALAELFGAGS